MTVAESSKPLSAPFVLIRQFFTSSIGAKVMMALTGLVIWGYAIGHVLGNLQVFLYAPEGGYLGQQINEYARFLKTSPVILWGTRAVLLVSFTFHIYYGLKMAARDRAARKTRYASGQYKERSTLASRTMAISGVVLLVFVVFHLAHFTWGFILPENFAGHDQANLHDVYWMMRKGFAVPWVAAFYVVSVVVLFAHLFHGSVSLWQHLGIRHARWTPLLRLGSRGLVLFLIAANVAIPVVLLAWAYSG
jgi:succinate dehydrogenase / fumarate reductase cytochrome b subunit